MKKYATCNVMDKKCINELKSNNDKQIINVEIMFVDWTKNRKILLQNCCLVISNNNWAKMGAGKQITNNYKFY